MQKRRVGKTSLEVTTFGLGTFPLGATQYGVSVDERQSVLQTAWDAGVRYFDTAPIYGRGASERAVGDAMRSRPRSDWILSTKVGRLLKPKAEWRTPVAEGAMPFHDEFDYSYDGIMRSFEHSLQRLGLAKIDILLAHDLGAVQHGQDGYREALGILRKSGYRALDELRSSGTVDAIGLGVNETQPCLDVLEFGDWDVFLLAGRYTLLEQAPLDTLLPLCRNRRTSLIVGGAFNSGILAGRDTYNYAQPPQSVLDRVEALKSVCGRHGVALQAAAIQFPLGHSAVASVIPGPRSAKELAENLAMMGYPIPTEFWRELQTTGLLRADAPVPSTPLSCSEAAL
jgi:D-threo-aldose 1-dehydrogenase